MKIGENVSVAKLVGDINHQKQEEVGSSTTIGTVKGDGSELLKNGG